MSGRIRYIIFGAGAVGSTIGGLLALHDKKAVLIGRKDHIDQIRENGLQLNSYEESREVDIPAFCDIRSIKPAEEDIILLTVKSNDTKLSLPLIRDIYPASTPIVSFQNGIANEPLISRIFPNCYSAVFRMTCFLEKPGKVNFREIGRIITGKYSVKKNENKIDTLIESISFDLIEAGFDVSISNHIMNDKWLKLTLNITSVATAIFSNPQIDRNLINQVKATLLQEAKAVLKAAGISTQPCTEKDKTIDQMIKHFGKKASPYRPIIPVYNSTWQGLNQNKPLEIDFFIGEILKLAAEHNIPITVNQRICEMSDFLEENGLDQFYYKEADVRKLLD